ncbi:MAG: hypothetical protein NTY90_03005 [Candidatus Micrarchaeota archaeon]|nr:hypothetical protein [Candidatus Micrarchaeota archaeon]
MKKPVVVRVRELEVEERAPPGPPEWLVVESFPRQQKHPQGQPRTQPVKRGLFNKIRGLLSAFSKKPA